MVQKSLNKIIREENKPEHRYVYTKFGPRTVATKKDQKSTVRKEENRKDIVRNQALIKEKIIFENDFSNQYIHLGKLPVRYIRNIDNPIEGYPKLDLLKRLKRKQILNHATKPYGLRVSTNEIVPVLNTWANNYKLKFDVIMIGALVENQFILPLIMSLPIHKLCAKPGFLFIWATTQKIKELSILLEKENFNSKFRRSEELIFLPLNKNSPYYPKDNDETIPLFERQQWHCWMCITGTVRRSTDNHLIHCNVDTDLQIESSKAQNHSVVPDALYRVAENFSNSNRRLHIIPSTIGYNIPVKLRMGWVIVSPDVLLNNFNPAEYGEEIYAKSSIQYRNTNKTINPQFLVPQTEEIEELRPKSPIMSTRL